MTGYRIFAPLAAACCVSLVACVPPTLGGGSAATLTPMAKGETVYAQCKGCHEAGAPSLKGLSFTRIKEGLTKPAMASFKDMSDDDVAALMAYLATLN